MNLFVANKHFQNKLLAVSCPRLSGQKVIKFKENKFNKNYKSTRTGLMPIFI